MPKTANEGTAAMILNTSIKYCQRNITARARSEAALFLRQQLDDRRSSHDDRKSRRLGRHYRERTEKWRRDARNRRHSLPYITAIALIDGQVTEKHSPERFMDPKI